jgi:hypothetical protein
MRSSSAHEHSSLEHFISWLISRVCFTLPKMYLCPPCLIPVLVWFVVLFQIRSLVRSVNNEEIESNY